MHMAQVFEIMGMARGYTDRQRGDRKVRSYILGQHFYKDRSVVIDFVDAILSICFYFVEFVELRI